jgi:hypothetical protein
MKALIAEIAEKNTEYAENAIVEIETLPKITTTANSMQHTLQ